jgi:hypothetical protein
MRRICITVALASITLVGTTAQARSLRPDPGLNQAQKLVSQGNEQLLAAHRRHPRGYGGHDIKAQRLLRRASRELSEAALYRKYNPGNS